ncbi:hypothetical protein B0H19DRAFT_1292726 [Mycena capillaripes]|nr:hypothetical protein B0H19DRAFT_1292726 [Mycena capillaripes]
MIARCRSKCWIIQLREENQELILASTQRGIKGHIIIYPQQASKIADILPPSVEEITSPVCVLFVGASPPTPNGSEITRNPWLSMRTVFGSRFNGSKHTIICTRTFVSIKNASNSLKKTPSFLFLLNIFAQMLRMKRPLHGMTPHHPLTNPPINLTKFLSKVL